MWRVVCVVLHHVEGCVCSPPSCGGLCDLLCCQMLLSEEEVRIKTQLWFAENADYLKELEGQSYFRDII